MICQTPQFSQGKQKPAMQSQDKVFCVHLPQTYLLMEKIITAYKKYLLFLCFAKDAFFFFPLTFFGFFWKYYFFQKLIGWA